MSLPEPTGLDLRGSVFLAEIHGQPTALRALLEHESEYSRVAATARERGATTVRMVGHGSSDNASSYGVYAFGLLPRWTAMRDSITLTAYYDARLDMRGSTVIALSQSGRTPDVVDYLARARSAGAFTVALTNDVGSDLAGAAEVVLPLAAGPERSVAASKTYLNQIAALGLFAACAATEGRRFAEDIRATADLLEEMLPALEEQARAVALSFASVGPDVRRRARDRVRDRPRDRAEAARDLPRRRRAADRDRARARPRRRARPAFPGLDDRLGRPDAPRRRRGRRASARGGCDPRRKRGRRRFARRRRIRAAGPRPPQPLLSPLLSVVPGQLFASALARARGLDADHPVGLSKVTLAR